MADQMTKKAMEKPFLEFLITWNDFIEMFLVKNWHKILGGIVFGTPKKCKH